jgi:GAF domain-containing protein
MSTRQDSPSHLVMLRTAIGQINQVTLPGTELQPLLDHLLHTMRELWPGFARLEIFLETDPDTYHRQAGLGVPEDEPGIPAPGSAAAQALAQRRLVVDEPDTGPIRWAVPLVRGDTTAGALAVEFAPGVAPPAQFDALLTTLAGPLALAIELAHTAPLIRALTLAQQLAAARTLQNMVGVVAEYVGKGHPLIDLTQYEYSDETPVRARAIVLSITAASELTDFSADMNDYPLEAAIPVLKQGLPVRIEDVYTTPLIAPDKHDYFRAQGISRLTVVPLITENRLIGAVSVAGPPLTPNELSGLQTLVNQIAARIQSQQLLEQTGDALGEVEQLYRFGSAILNAKTPASLVQAVYAQFSTPPDTLALEAVKLDAAGTVAEFQTEAGSGPEGPLARSALAAAQIKSIQGCARALLQGIPYIVNNAKNDPAISDQARTHFTGQQVQALGVFPIRLDDTLTHAITTTYQTPHIYTAREIQLLQRLTEQIALQVSNWALLRQTQEQTERLTRHVQLLESLYETARQVSTSLASPETLKTTCQTLSDTLRLDYVAITRSRVDHSTLLAEHPARLGRDVKLSPFTGLRERPVVINLGRDPSLDPNLAPLHMLGLRTTLVAPLLAQGDSLGLLILATTDEKRAFGQEEVQVAQALATQIATSLRNAELFAEIQHRASQLERISAFGRLITSSLNWNEILQHVVDVIPNLLAADHVGLALHDQKDNRMRWIALSKSTSPREELLPITGSSVEEVLRTQLPMLITDVSTSGFTDHKHLAELGFETALLAPMIAGSSPLGTVIIGHARKHEHTPTDLTLLQQVGNQIAIALENARRYASARQHAQYEEALSAITSNLQQQTDIRDLLRQTMQGLGNVLGAHQARVRLLKQSTSDGAESDRQDHA